MSERIFWLGYLSPRSFRAKSRNRNQARRFGARYLDSGWRLLLESNMAFWTYILRCADGRYYTGHTDNLEQRVGQHQTGGFCDYTSRRLPVTLVWSQDFPSRIEALEAERIVGGWSRAKKEALIAGDWAGVSLFAKPPAERFAETGFSTSLETNGGGGSTPYPARKREGR